MNKMPLRTASQGPRALLIWLFTELSQPVVKPLPLYHAFVIDTAPCYEASNPGIEQKPMFALANSVLRAKTGMGISCVQVVHRPVLGRKSEMTKQGA